MRAFLLRGLHELLWRRTDAGVDHVKARVARTHGDLLGAVRVAVQSGLADQELRALADLLRNALDLASHLVERAANLARRGGDARRRAIFAEDAAQCAAPFAGRHASLGRRDRRLDHVATLLRRARKLFQRRLRGLLLARRTPSLQALDLLGLDMLWHHHDRVLAGGERRRLAFDELVDADDDLLARFDRLEPSCVRFDEL